MTSSLKMVGKDPRTEAAAKAKESDSSSTFGDSQWEEPSDED